MLEYAQIARALTNLPMDERSKQRTKRKFEVSYMIVKEKFALTKMQPPAAWKRNMELTWVQAIGTIMPAQHSLSTSLVISSSN